MFYRAWSSVLYVAGTSIIRWVAEGESDFCEVTDEYSNASIPDSIFRSSNFCLKMLLSLAFALQKVANSFRSLD